MPTTPPDPVTVRAGDDHVEVTGLSEQDVEYAISLYQAVPAEQLRARDSLAAHVNQAMLEKRIPLIPAGSQRQVQRNAELRQELLETHGAETYASLAELRGMQESSVRTWVARARHADTLFTVELAGRTLIPRVQLSDSGDLRPVITELTRPLLRVGLDGWSLWAWLVAPTGRLSGGLPAEVATTNMDRAHRAVLRYAAELGQAAESGTPAQIPTADGAERTDAAE